MGAELTEATIPAEAGQWLIDASVSFTKGCYTGQELVARIDSRGGNVPRPLRGPARRRRAGAGRRVGHASTARRSVTSPRAPRSAGARRHRARPDHPHGRGRRAGVRRRGRVSSQAATVAELPAAVTHYEVLGVAPTAPTSEVRRAYVALARQHHPGPSERRRRPMRADQRRVGDAPRPRPPRRLRPQPRSRPRASTRRARPSARPAPSRTSMTSWPTSTTTHPIGGQVVLPRWLSLLPGGDVRGVGRRCSWPAMLFSSPAGARRGVRALRPVVRDVPDGAVRGAAGVATPRVGSPPTMATYLDRILEQHRAAAAADAEPIEDLLDEARAQPPPAWLPRARSRPRRRPSWPSSPR